jgi:two-component system response regulator CpxR
MSVSPSALVPTPGHAEPAPLPSRRTRVLVIDDDVRLCALLRDLLESEGFLVEVENTGLKGMRRAATADLVVLGMMLPDVDGLAVLRHIRMRSITPVIAITARGDEEERIAGLEAGADDYLAKPFNPRELSARLRAVWRRTRLQLHTTARGPVHVEEVVLDPGVRKVFVNGDPAPLTTLEFDILEVLIRAAGRVVSRDELALHVYNRVPGRFDRSLDMHVSHLRRKIGSGRQMIQTVRGSGYQFLRAGKAAA